MTRTPPSWNRLPNAHRCLYAGLAASFDVRALERAPWDDLSPADALDLVRLAEAIDMAGVVAANLQTAGLLARLPAGAPARLMAQRLARVSDAHARLAWLARLEGELAVRGLGALALKGSALLLAGTRHAAERGMGDVDLLVRPEQRVGLAEALVASCSREGALPRRPPGGDWSFESDAGLVELHLQVFDKIGPFRPQSRALWETALPATGHAALQRCAPAYVAAHAAVEYGLEGFHGMGSDLRGIHDLAALLQAGLDEGAASGAARRVGCGWLLREMLTVAHEFLEGRADAWVALWERNPPLDPAAPRLRGYRYRLAKYRRIPTLSGRALTLWREVFPILQPGDGPGAYLAALAAPWVIRIGRLGGAGRARAELQE